MLLLKLLREIFGRGTPTGLPRDETGCDKLMAELWRRGEPELALAVYDAAVANGLSPCGEPFDAAYRRALVATSNQPYPLRRRLRFQNLYTLLEAVLPLDGTVVECGCFRGMSSHLMLGRLILAEPGIAGHGYRILDSFEGLSEPGTEDAIAIDHPKAVRLGQMCQAGAFAASLETVRRGLAEFPAVEFHRGWIPQSLAGLPELRYRFVHLDLDLHAPTLAALEYFHPRLVEGGILVCDDYSWPGARKAIEGFCARRDTAFETTPHGQAVLRQDRRSSIRIGRTTVKVAPMGPLAGLKILEFEAIGPGPFCGMMLADMGADVLLIDRPEDPRLGLGRDRWSDVMLRGRRSATLDLKSKNGVEAACELAGRADAVIEGFRPGVMERLGLGPQVLLQRNPKLVYGRMTGWGQDGPLSARAGHDINYIALTGVLHAIGRASGAPVPPLNLIGDFGGGGMLLAFGIACALFEAQRSGRGQVVDAAMVDGASLLATMFSGMLAAGRWSETRGENLLDTGAPWYDVYETKDGKHVAIGSIEPKFYEELLVRLGIQDRDLPAQQDRKGWPALRKLFAAKFAEKTRDDWCKVFDGSDACFAPVLTFSEARAHPHNAARGNSVSIGRVEQPAPAPRYSRTPGAIRRAPPERGEGGSQALVDWGFSTAEIGKLRSSGLNFEE